MMCMRMIMYIDVSTGIRIDMDKKYVYRHVCRHMYMHALEMRMDMWIDVCIGMYTGTGKSVCIDMRIFMCVNMRREMYSEGEARARRSNDQIQCRVGRRPSRACAR